MDDSTSLPEPSTVADMKEDKDSITGMKLIVVMIGIACVMLLCMIDISIITTVGRLQDS